MKIIRLLYITAVYILSTPLLLLGIIGVIVYEGVYSIYEHAGLDDFKYVISGLADGLSEGHKLNMRFVKNGRRGYQIMEES